MNLSLGKGSNPQAAWDERLQSSMDVIGSKPDQMSYLAFRSELLSVWLTWMTAREGPACLHKSTYE